MSRLILILVGVIAASLSACAPPDAPEGALPIAMRDAPVPPVDASAYVYIRPPGNATFTSEVLGVDGLTLDSADVLLGEGQDGVAARFITSARGDAGANSDIADHWIDLDATSLRFGPDSPWGQEVGRAWSLHATKSYAQHFSGSWTDLQMMPESPPEPPIAAGFVRNFGPLLENLVNEIGVSVPNLADGLSLVRINRISFVAYSDNFPRLPASVGPDVLRDLDVSILAVADSSYPSAVVGQVFDGFVSSLGLSRIAIAETVAHHRQLSDGIHVIVLRDDATLFFGIAPRLDRAMALVEAVATQRDEG
jgi:hypothetical protein